VIFELSNDNCCNPAKKIFQNSYRNECSFCIESGAGAGSTVSGSASVGGSIVVGSGDNGSASVGEGSTVGESVVMYIDCELDRS